MLRKKIFCLYFAAAFCVPHLFAAEAYAGKELTVFEDSTLTVLSCNDGKSSYSEGNSVYKPREPGAKFCYLKIKMKAAPGTTMDKNYFSGGEFLKASRAPKYRMELVSVGNGGGKDKLVQFSPIAAVDEKVKINKDKNEATVTLYFIRFKNMKAVALAVNKATYLPLVAEGGKDYVRFTANMERYGKIDKFFEFINGKKFDAVKDYMDKNGLDMNDENINGLTLFYYALAEKNSAIAEGAMKNGADIKRTFSLMGETVSAIHLAIISHDRKIAKMLVEAGLDPVDPPGTSILPGLFAVEQKDLEALKILNELGVNLFDQRFRVPGGANTLSYARNRGYKEIVDYLEGLKKQ